MMARDHDIVQRGNHNCDETVQCILGFTLNKSNDVCCSKWSVATLSKAQATYAALDVIKPLEAYYKILEMPDLSQPMDPGCCTPGVLVDIVLPHARNNRHKAGNGFQQVGDLATRGAIGMIAEVDRVSNPTGVSPGHVKANEQTCVVEITEVLAPSLAVPRHQVCKGNKKEQAYLGDFQLSGNQSFQIVLSLTMLRKHLPASNVRTCNACPMVQTMTLRITPPNPVNCATGATGLDTGVDGSEARFDAIINDAVGDDSSIIDLITNDDSIDDSAANEDQNANYEIRKEHLEAIASAAEAAERVQNNPMETELLYCAELDAVPDHIDQVFSAVLGDPYHCMDRAKVPVRHEYKKAFKVALSRAWLQWDKLKLDKVSDTLKENGWTDANISNKRYFQHSFFAEQVRRVQLPPHQQYMQVGAVFVKFGNKIDSKMRMPLFNKVAWGKAKNILKDILLGYYSDPPGSNFYQYQLNADGMPKVDKYGIKLIRCCCGTNDVENIHKHYHTIFRYTAGIELGDFLLAERRHRHNNRTAVRRIPDYPDVGHYNTWQIDKLQIIVEKNHGILLFPLWVNSSDYSDSAESFATVAMHSMEIDTALKEHATGINAEVKKAYRGDLGFLCHQLGIPIPFLPVDGKDEYQLFSRLLFV
jgi:hypothetical protein